MIDQPTRATIAATSRTDPPAERALVRRIPSNGAIRTPPTLLMTETRKLPVRAFRSKRTMRSPITIWIRPKTRTTMRRAVSLLLGRTSTWLLVTVRLLEAPDSGVVGLSLVTLRCSSNVMEIFFLATDDGPASGHAAG